MSKYGVTEKGFVLKRMDTILEEIHSDLTEGLGIDTRLNGNSLLNTLITTYAGQIADLWETAQDSYYAKFPATATGLNLDNAVQYGGVFRESARRSAYKLHCTGDDGTVVSSGVQVASDTTPAITLYAPEQFSISRSRCNSLTIRVAVVEKANYAITLNGKVYTYPNADASTSDITILNGLKELITDDEYAVTVDEESSAMKIADTELSRNNEVILSENLTTKSVTSIATFQTEDYGKIAIPNGLITVMVSNIAGFTAVTNLLNPSYGQQQETDTELRHSYMKKKALRSNMMLDSIVAELLDSVDNVESAVGFENDTDTTDSRGLPPHSIEVIVDGGDAEEIAKVILLKKAAGIQTYGSISIDVPGMYGDTIPVRFNRPEYLYTWLKIMLHGDQGIRPSNFEALTVNSVVEYVEGLASGDDLLIQLLLDGIYDTVSGITYVSIAVAYSGDSTYTPTADDYKERNIITTTRQKILLSEKRIEVSFVADT